MSITKLFGNAMTWKEFWKLISSNVQFAHMKVTDRCNLRCGYCYSNTFGEDMSLDVAKRTIDALLGLNAGSVWITGGEPTLNRDLVKILSYTQKHNLATGLATNGLDKKGNAHSYVYLEDLVGSGLNFVSVSLDSVRDTDVSEKSLERLEPLFDRFVQLRGKYGTIIQANVVINRQNMYELRSLVEFARRKDILIGFSLNMPPLNSDCHVLENPALLYGEDGYRYLSENTCAWLIREQQAGNILGLPEYFKDMQQYLQGRHNMYCSAWKKYLAVDNQGNVLRRNRLSQGPDAKIWELTENKLETYRAQFEQEI